MTAGPMFESRLWARSINDWIERHIGPPVGEQPRVPSLGWTSAELLRYRDGVDSEDAAQ